MVGNGFKGSNNRLVFFIFLKWSPYRNLTSIRPLPLHVRCTPASRSETFNRKLYFPTVSRRPSPLHKCRRREKSVGETVRRPGRAGGSPLAGRANLACLPVISSPARTDGQKVLTDFVPQGSGARLRSEKFSTGLNGKFDLPFPPTPVHVSSERFSELHRQHHFILLFIHPYPSTTFGRLDGRLTT